MGAEWSNAQAPLAKNHVIGLLDAGERLEWWAAFRQRMHELGYIDGRNLVVETRYARGDVARLSPLAQELVRLKVGAIVTSGRVATEAAMRATRTIPIVTATGDDPALTGMVASLGRPGGNVTGVTSISRELNGKRLELLREILPKLSRLAVVWHRDNSPSALSVKEIEAAARSAKVVLHVTGVKTANDIAGAFAAMTHERMQAVFVIASPMLYSERQRIGELALKHHLPSMSGVSDYADAGGLVSYGPNYPELFRRAAVYVDKIFKGARPGELPIEQPTHVSLVVNLKTARALGLTIPPVVLLRAERVIE